MADNALLTILEGDLRQLAVEAKKTDNIAHQLTGWLSHSELPNVREGTERALQRLQSLSSTTATVERIRNTRVTCLSMPARPSQCLTYSRYLRSYYSRSSPRVT
jgi:hypothetical protein